MKKYINDLKKKCYILNEYRNDEEVKYEASEYWVLYLYIISLKEIQGEKPKFLVLEYPSYTEIDNNGIINDCIWSVPYMAYLLKKDGTKRYNSVGEIIRFYDKQIKSHEKVLTELENYRFYHMGVSNYEKTEGKSYIEYKKSSRQPDKWKCYYIREFYITKIDSLGLLNLADPEGLHGYRYFPLNEEPSNNPNKTIGFLGKHLSSNISYILRNSWNNLETYANPIDNKLLVYNLNGIIFKIDIVGFTKIFNTIIETMGTLEQSGEDIAKEFIAQISSIFEKNLRLFDITQYVIEGDGITGTCPIYKPSNEKNTLKKLLELIEKIHDELEMLVKRIGISIKLRCSITCGEYSYGKITGLKTLQKGFSGDVMIVLSRMDQYLKDIENNFDENIIGFNTALFYKHKDILNKMGYTKCVSQTDKFKETKIDTIVHIKE